MKIHGPKFVKKANMWLVSVTSESKTKRGTPKQEMEWFFTEEEAHKFIKSKEA